jgi:hypothetical protein
MQGEAPELLHIPQWLEYRPIELISEVDFTRHSVVKAKPHTEAVDITRFN